MKKILIYLLLGVSLFACNDSDDDTGARKVNVKNEFRVKEIRGTNAHWGNYTMGVSYYAEELDSAWVYNAQKDTLDILTTQEIEGGIEYDIYDFVPNIDADSIRRLEELYGEKAKDSIPMVTRKLYSLQVIYDNERVQSQAFSFYMPREDMGVGQDFNNKYLNNYRTRYYYEYDQQGYLIICRMLKDVYLPDPDDNAEFERSVNKLVFSYVSGRVSVMDEFRAEDQYGSSESYVKSDTWNFVYTGEKLTAVNGVTYQYEGNSVSSITRDGQTVRYSYNSDGYLKRIEWTNGEYMEMKYESGNGNFGVLSPLLEQNWEVPYVR